jgi:murein DD-endopeptidase MepM/ murein hydrolase activator NlpD
MVFMTGTAYGLKPKVAPNLPAPAAILGDRKAAASEPTQAATAAPAPNAPAGQANAVVPTVVPKREKIETYTVASGDMIGTIAEKFGLKTTTVLWANNLSDVDTLAIGQKLLIPAVDGLVYKTVAGDSLSAVASAYDAEPQKIVEANPDVDPTAIPVGQILLIPGGKPSVRVQVASRGSGRSSIGSFEIWPAHGPITSEFGWRIHPVYGTRSFHDGTDIGVGYGTPLLAVADGTVTMAARLGSYGFTVKIDHGQGLVTQYSHMSQFDVEVGQKVQVGQQIGYSGNSGVSTGAHLHFSVIVDGTPTDPMAWLP